MEDIKTLEAKRAELKKKKAELEARMDEVDEQAVYDSYVDVCQAIDELDDLLK